MCIYIYMTYCQHANLKRREYRQKSSPINDQLIVSHLRVYQLVLILVLTKSKSIFHSKSKKTRKVTLVVILFMCSC